MAENENIVFSLSLLANVELTNAVYSGIEVGVTLDLFLRASASQSVVCALNCEYDRNFVEISGDISKQLRLGYEPCIIPFKIKAIQRIPTGTDISFSLLENERLVQKANLHLKILREGPVGF